MTARTSCPGSIWLSLCISSNKTALIPLQICSSNFFQASLLSSLGLHVTLVLTNCGIPERVLPRTRPRSQFVGGMEIVRVYLTCFRSSKANNLECKLLLLRSNLLSQKAINAPIQPHTSLISPEKRMDDQPKAPNTGKILPKTNQRFPLTLAGYRARDVSVMSSNSMTSGRTQYLFSTGCCCHVPLEGF